MAEVVREILLCLLFSALLGVAIGWLARGLRGRFAVRGGIDESRRALGAGRAEVHLNRTEQQQSRTGMEATAQSARDEAETLRRELREAGLARDAARHDASETREQLLKLAERLKSAEAARLAGQQELDGLQAARAKAEERAEDAERERDTLRREFAQQPAPTPVADATRQHLDTLRATLQAAEAGWDGARAQAAAAHQASAATRRQLAESEADRQALSARLVEAQNVLLELRARLDAPPPVAPPLTKTSASPGPSDGTPAPKSRARPLKDDLQQIRGIGPVLERTLHQRGIYRYAQIASWTPEDILAVARRLPGFHERIVRDEWPAAARKLHIAKYGSPP